MVVELSQDPDIKVVLFTSSLADFFFNHFDLAHARDFPVLPGANAKPAWTDLVLRLTEAPFVSIGAIRGRTRGGGNELMLAFDLRYASREKAIFGQPEVGTGILPGGGGSERLPRQIGRDRALEAILSSDDYDADQAEKWGWVTRALPDAELDGFVDALATRISGFDKWAIANTKRLVNTSLPPDVELGAGWDACIASLGRPAAQDNIKALLARGFHKPGDVENRLGYYIGQLTGHAGTR